MNTIEIICEACDGRMRLSPSLLTRIQGRSGRITCKQCSNKVGLDACGDGIAVIFGGVLLECEDQSAPASSADDPHLSEAPLARESDSRSVRSARASSLPPPLPIEVRARRHQSVEAPLPPSVRGLEDSLSPHSFDDGDSLAALAHDIRSTPYSAPPPRDQTYKSLYPEPQPKASRQVTTLPFGSRAPTPPRAGELHRSMSPSQNPFESGYGIDVPQGPQTVVVTADGQLLNQADIRHIRSLVPGLSQEKSARAPWILAAVALFALGISLSAQVQQGVSLAWSSATGAQDAGAAAAPEITHAASVPDVLIEAKIPEESELDSQESAKVNSEEATVVGQGVVASGKNAHLAAAGAVKASPRSSPATSTAAAKQTSTAAVSPESEATTEAVPFSSGAAAASMREATALSSACRSTTDPSGTAKVVVTFAPSGRVTSATVSGPPFAGTQTGGCIASRFRAARVPAFSGEAVTVTKTVTVR